MGRLRDIAFELFQEDINVTLKGYLEKKANQVQQGWSREARVFLNQFYTSYIPSQSFSFAYQKVLDFAQSLQSTFRVLGSYLLSYDQLNWMGSGSELKNKLEKVCERYKPYKLEYIDEEINHGRSVEERFNRLLIRQNRLYQYSPSNVPFCSHETKRVLTLAYKNKEIYQRMQQDSKVLKKNFSFEKLMDDFVQSNEFKKQTLKP